MSDVAHRRLVRRHRVLDLVDARFSRRLVVIEAGAGFGKTSVLRQAVAEAASLERSIEVAVSARGKSLEERTGQALVAEVAHVLGCAPTVAGLADAALGASPRDFVLWLDDAHLISGLAELVDDLVTTLPHNGHLVLVGRSLPPLRTHRLELAEEIARIGEDELRFDGDEQAAFMHLRGADPSADLTSGWPALMELELLAGRSGAIDYLADEVLGGLSAERLAALRRLASLDTIDEAMLAAATDFDGSLLDLVEGLALVQVHPAVPIDGSADAEVERDPDAPEPAESVVVELHDLVRDALRRGRSDAETRRALVAIGRELLRRGDVNGAVRRFARAGDRQGIEAVALRLIHDLHFAAAVGDRVAAVEIVLAELGESAEALTLRAVNAAMVDPLHAPAVLAEAVAAAREAQRTDLEATAILWLAELAHNRGDVAEIRRCRALLDELGELEERAARFAILPRIWERRLTGRVAEIAPLVDDALAAMPPLGAARAGAAPELDRELLALLLFNRTISLAYVGRIREALAQVDQHAAELPPGLFADRLGGFVTIQKWMLGELTPDVLQHAARLVDRIERRGQSHLFVEGAATVSIFSATSGDLDAAEEFVRRAERMVGVLADTAWALHSVVQARAVVDVLRGDESAAAARLDASIPDSGLDDGLPSHVYNLTAPLSYLLVPRTRPSWDARPIDPDLVLRRDVAHALVAFREQGDVGPAAALPWREPARLRPWLLEPHLVELAVAAISGGSPEAVTALRTLRTDVFPSLRGLAESSSTKLAKAADRAIRLTPRRPAAAVEIDVLGEFAVRRDGTDESASPAWRRARVVDVLFALVVERRTSRRHLAEVLWPEKDPSAAMNNLRVNLSHLLAALDPDRDPASPSWFVRSDGDVLSLETSELFRLDVDRFERLVEDARRLDATSPREALDVYVAACDAYGGDYLASSPLADRAFFDVVRLRGDFVVSAVRAADLLLAMGEAGEAERLATRACNAEPLNESAQRSLATAMIAQRRIGVAIEIVRRVLLQLAEVELPPEPATRQLATRLGL